MDLVHSSPAFKSSENRREKPRFSITLEALPGIDAIKALRAALKQPLRQHGLKCVGLHEQPNNERRSSARWRAGPLGGGEFGSARNGTVTERSPVMGIDLKKYVKGRFYSLAEVFDQPAPRERIAAVKDGQYGKPVLVFETGRQAALNQASLGILMREFGDDPNTWIGKWVEPTAGQTKDQNGNLIDALIVRPADAAPSSVKPSSLPTARPKARPSSAEMNDDIPF
jgi:hypothetical protein